MANYSPGKTKRRTQRPDFFKRDRVGKIVVFDNSRKRDSKGKQLALFAIPYDTPFEDPYISGIGRKDCDVRRTKDEADKLADKIVDLLNKEA